MGAGKTTVGRILATRAGTPFTDLDAEIGDVAAIFAREGEAGFRERERAALARAAAGEGILALGGGTLEDPRNRLALREWRVVVLTARVEVLRARVGGGAGRPLAAELERLLAERDETWRAAGPMIDTSDLSPEAVAGAIAW